jgi:group I intron endonuclease
MFIVYKHTCKHNGKVYVGITSGDLDPTLLMTKRWMRHCYAAKKGEQLSFSKAIRKYGEDSFYHDVIEVCESEKEVLQREAHWIVEFGSRVHENGYNMTSGGESRSGENNPRARLTEENVTEIKLAWNAEQVTGNTVGAFYEKFAVKFGVTNDNICHLIHGRTWSHAGPKVNNIVNLRGKNSSVAKKMKDLWYDPVKHEQWSIARRGEQNGRAKITEEDVKLIRKNFLESDVSKFGAKSVFYRTWATKLKVTPDLICGIVKYRCWKNT